MEQLGWFLLGLQLGCLIAQIVTGEILWAIGGLGLLIPEVILYKIEVNKK